MGSEFWVSLVNIVIIDLVLSGDNAVVIAMAVQHLPPGIRTRASVVGALGAVGLRVAFASLVALVTGVPLLQALGALALFWIAYHLLVEKEEDVHSQHEIHGFWEAVRIIILADLVMSLDNVLAVGGAAHGHLGLLIFGLAVSIPLVLFGSSVLTALLKKWPVLSYVGSGVLAWTAGRMLVHDRWLHEWIEGMGLTTLDDFFPMIGTAAVVGAGYWFGHRRHARENALELGA